MGNRLLVQEYPVLFNCVRDRKAMVSTYMARSGDPMQSGPIFRKNLTLMELEENQFFFLLETLSHSFFRKKVKIAGSEQRLNLCF